MGHSQAGLLFDLDPQRQVVPVYYGARRRQVKGILGNSHVSIRFPLLKQGEISLGVGR